MHKYFLVSWSILGTNTCQKWGIKPAWKLIQTFKVQISYFFGSVVRFWNHSIPSNATIKPYIQNIISEKKGFLKLLPIPRSVLNHSNKQKQTKMLVTCQRFGDWFLFGLVWPYSSNQKNIMKVGSKSLLLTCSSNKLWAYLPYFRE